MSVYFQSDSETSLTAFQMDDFFSDIFVLDVTVPFLDLMCVGFAQV